MWYLAGTTITSVHTDPRHLSCPVMTGRHRAYREHKHRDVDAAVMHPTITRHVLHCVTWESRRPLTLNEIYLCLTDCELVSENEYAKVRE